MDRRTLTKREVEVVDIIMRGGTNQDTARALGVSMATVKRHLANVMIKWNCANRTQVAVRAVERSTRMEGRTSERIDEVRVA